MKKTLNILLALPEPVAEFCDNTVDYLGLGLSDVNIPDLIDISREQHLLLGDDEGDDGGEAADSDKMAMLCVHAWRALTAFCDPEIIPEFFDLLEEASTHDNELYFDNFSDLMGSFGADAIDYMVTYVESERHTEENKVMLIEALGAMAEDEDLSPRVFDFFERYLRAERMTRTTNAFIICEFLDRKAAEYHQVIKDSFAVHLVNVIFCGDLEECEIALGVREERKTEQPDLIELNVELESLARKEIAGELAANASNDEVINHCLFVYGGESSMANTAAVDGLLLASLLAPVLVPPSKFIPYLWDVFGGDPDKQVRWKSEEEAKRFFEAVLALYQENSSLLVSQKYTPYKSPRKGELGLVDRLSPWLLGFLIGLRLWEEQNQNDPMLEAFAELSNEILNIEDGRDLKVNATARQEFILEGLIEKAYRERVAGASPSFEREQSSKVGRNDVCPCGSGKKYKRCCMN